MIQTRQRPYRKEPKQRVPEPTYDYVCTSCGKGISDHDAHNPNFICPDCDNTGLEQEI